MARGKNKRSLFGRTSTSSKIFSKGRRGGFPPGRTSPSKTTTKNKKPLTKGPDRTGLFGRTNKDGKDPTPSPKAPQTKIGYASPNDGWKYKATNKDFSGPYHQQSNGKYYEGSKAKRRSIFSRRKNKEVYQLAKPQTSDPSPLGIPTPPVAKSWGPGIKRIPARGGGVVVTTSPYKEIDRYINQYPAEESSVAPAKDSINPQYTSAGLRGHFNTESFPPLAVSYAGNPPSIGQVQTVGGTFMEFILEFGGEFFTSPQYKSKLQRAASENNPYFRIDRNAIPIISFDTTNPAFSTYGDQFQKEDDYAMVDVNYGLSNKTRWVQHIDYMTRKTSVNQGVKTPEEIYGSKPWTVRGTVTDIDAILESAGKAPKVRFKGQVTGPPVEAKSSPPPKKKKKIICNELYQQGYLPEHIWDADERWGDKTFITDPKLVIGYQMWARKVVEFMRKKPQYTPAIYFLCKPWTEWMAYDLGVLPKNNLKGQLTQFVGRYFSYAVYDLFGGDKLYKRYHKLT